MIFKIIIKNTLVKNALKNWAKNKMQNMRSAKLNLHFFKKKTYSSAHRTFDFAFALLNTAPEGEGPPGDRREAAK